MQLTLSVLALASTAAAVAKAGFEFPSDVPLDKRQTEGPRYECHADCGFALRGSSEDGYCDDSEWLDLFNGCLDCALEFDIWRHYGNGLTPAAESCGLDATPKPADGDDEEPTTSAEEVATETSAVETTTVDVTVTEESTAAESTTTVEVTATKDSTVATATEEVSSTWTTDAHHTESHSHSEGATIITTATWTSAYVPTGTGALNTTAHPEPTEVPGNGAGQNWISNGLVGCAAIVLAVNLM